MPATNHETPVEKVSASLTFVGFGMRPDELTGSLGIQPSFTDVSYVTRCETGRKEECGLWSYDTAANVASRDVGEHIEHLLDLFRPLMSRIDEKTPRPNVFLHVKCEATSIMRPLVAPRIGPDHVAGIAGLGAALQVELLEATRWPNEQG